MDEFQLEFYGPIIVGNSMLQSQKNPIIFKHKPIQNFGIDSYNKNNIEKTNNLNIFGNINSNYKSSKIKYYKKFLYNNRNNFHTLSDNHLNNLIKLLNKYDITEKDIPKSFKVIPKNKPFYPSNNYN